MSPPPSRSTLLEGKVCLVSGVGPGLGRQAALALGSHGADVVLAARRLESLEAVAAELEDCSGRVLCVPTNIADPEQCQALAQTARRELGGVDVLVNNAFRMDVFQTFEDVDLTAWRKVLDTNVFGSLQMIKAVVPLLRERSAGSVINVGSMITRKPQPLEGGYAIAKGALMTATRVLASELGSAGIRVNSVVPGWMWGPSVKIYVEMTVADRGITEDEVTSEIASRIPLGRIPTDEEVAGVIVFLASDLSAAVTGQAIDANGGEVFH